MLFVQSESAEPVHASSQDPEVVAMADFENQRRFLSFDLLYAHPVRDDLRVTSRRMGVERSANG